MVPVISCLFITNLHFFVVTVCSPCYDIPTSLLHYSNVFIQLKIPHQIKNKHEGFQLNDVN